VFLRRLPFDLDVNALSPICLAGGFSLDVGLGADCRDGGTAGLGSGFGGACVIATDLLVTGRGAGVLTGFFASTFLTGILNFLGAVLRPLLHPVHMFFIMSRISYNKKITFSI